MTKILGLSGKKSSGKNTAANWIIGQQMCAIDLVSYVKINAKGQLVVPAMIDGELREGVFDPTSSDPAVRQMLSHYIWPVVKLYSFADVLKMSVCAILGLDERSVNGTNDEKNALTKYEWIDFKQFVTQETKKNVTDWLAKMSGREILQVVGTDIFRRVDYDVWVNACLRQIEFDKPELAIVTDCRFPNEVNGIQKAGGKVVRFTRAPFADGDQHKSETALDNYDKFDATIDNATMSIEQQNEAVTKLLTEWGFNTWKWTV